MPKIISQSDGIYNFKRVQCGNSVELYRYERAIIKGVRDKNIKCERKKIERTDEEKFDIRKKNLNATRNRLARLIRSNSDMTTFITLTFATEPTIEESKKIMRLFLERLKRNFGKDLKYLWVVEFGELNGRLHYHFLTNIKFETNYNNGRKNQQHILLEDHFSKKIWKQGIVDIRNLKKEGINNISGYLSFYITKSMLDFKCVNQQIYNHSRNLDKPVISTYLTTIGIEELLIDDEEMELKYQSKYSCFGKKNVVYFSYQPK